MSKKQEISNEKTASPGNTFGNLDKAQQFEFPAEWAQNPDVVVVYQEQFAERDGTKSVMRDTGRVQVYAKSIFETQWPIPEGAKENGFERLGLKVTPLHKTGVSEDFDKEDNIDLPLIPSADTATTAADEIKKETLQAAKDGDTETAAEEFKERSQEDAQDKAHSIAVENKDEDGKTEKAPTKTASAKTGGEKEVSKTVK